MADRTGGRQSPRLAASDDAAIRARPSARAGGHRQRHKRHGGQCLQRSSAASTRAAAACAQTQFGIQALSRQFLVLRAATAGVVAVLGVRELLRPQMRGSVCMRELNLVTGSAGQTRSSRRSCSKSRSGPDTAGGACRDLRLSCERPSSWACHGRRCYSSPKAWARSSRSAARMRSKASPALHQFTQGFTHR